MADLLDYKTLFTCTCVVTGSAALAMFYVSRAHRRDASVRYWFLGFASWFMACMTFALRDQLPPYVWMLMGNLFGALSSTLVYMGTARFLGKPFLRRQMWAIHIAGVGGLAYGATLVEPLVRLTVYDAWLTVMCSMMVRDLWSDAFGAHRSTYRFVAVVWAMVVVMCNMRTAVVILGDPETVALATGPRIGWPLLIWLLTSMSAAILSCVGYLLMVSQRLQEKNNWARVEEIFHEALALPATKRPAYLREICDGDSVLLAELESLVRAAETPAAELDSAVSVDSRRTQVLGISLGPGVLLGGYRIESTLGHGGMGEVYLAQREVDALPVAVKVLKREALQHAGRFETEYRIVSALDHPRVARFLESGLTPDGRPYMAMEYVAGRPLTVHVQEQRLALRQRLELFAQVCEAVSYAHGRLVVHRDLKPGNILVTADDSVKLLDFGVAKMLNPVMSLQSEATVTMAVPVTVEYAAPEQLQGESTSIATDVYALGVLLYELLTGELPWNLKELPISVGVHKILNETPQLTSQAAQGRKHSPVLPRLLRGSLDSIVARALNKDPRDRYPTVDSMRQDVLGYLGGQAVTATPGPLARFFGRLGGHRIR